MPMISKPPSGFISATIAAIFDVPMSRPTIRCFISLALLIKCCSSSFLSGRVGVLTTGRLRWLLACELRYANCKSIRITQVDVIEPALQAADAAFVDGDKAVEARFDV